MSENPKNEEEEALYDSGVLKKIKEFAVHVINDFALEESSATWSVVDDNMIAYDLLITLDVKKRWHSE